MIRTPDNHLQALRQELRVALNELNNLHHPVYPGDPRRIDELERAVDELQQAIADRRRLLAAEHQRAQLAAAANHG